MHTVSMKLPDPLAAELAAQAERRKLSKSALIREALTRYLAEPEDGEARPTPGSFLERARHLAGSVKGAPADLSDDPAHLEGYGR